MNEGAEIGEGRYLYSIINNGVKLSFGCIGINENTVYTVPYKDIAAVVHSCQASAYGTTDDDKAKEWLLSHNYVIDRAGKQFGTVLPFSFDCLTRGNDDTVKNWLSQNYEKLKGELGRLRDRDEYSVQIFCDQDALVVKNPGSYSELKGMKEMIEKLPKGAAYLFQRRFELTVKEAISTGIMRLASECCSLIIEHVEEMKPEKNTSQVPEKFKGKKPVVALACLVHKDRVEKLGEVLDRIDKREGLAVRFTGPWAPFSFVRLKEI